jgi:shikimate dehydrogenase
MNKDMLALGLTGYPLGHSLSPRLHQAALRAAGLEGAYRLYPVPPLPEGRAALEALLERLRRGELHGLNVTIPHKQSALPLLDALSPAAQAIGAVNTLWLRDGCLWGDNTDAAGFAADLARGLPAEPAEKQALVLGAGGAARAVIAALLQAGWRVTLAARRVEQAQALAAALFPLAHPSASITAISLSTLFSSIHKHQFSIFNLHFALLVNTTPLGMHPHEQASPWHPNLPLPRGALVYDLVYNPAETMLARQARRQGLRAVTGAGMLVEQAALAFERWTGVLASREAMRAAIEEALSQP